MWTSARRRLGGWLYHRVRGASARTVAPAWSRHAVELPSLNRQLTWWTGRLTALALFGVLSFGVVFAADELWRDVGVVFDVTSIASAIIIYYIYLAWLLRLIRRIELVAARACVRQRRFGKLALDTFKLGRHATHRCVGRLEAREVELKERWPSEHAAAIA